jgi:hypothetical protein
MAKSIRDPGREAFWRRNVTAFGRSGLSVRAFCQREKLTESAFYFWRRTIHERGPAQRKAAQRTAKQSPRKSPAFVPLMFGDMAPAVGVTLELRGGRALRFSESFPVERLAGLVLALEAAEGRT